MSEEQTFVGDDECALLVYRCIHAGNCTCSTGSFSDRLKWTVGLSVLCYICKRDRGSITVKPFYLCFKK